MVRNDFRWSLFIRGLFLSAGRRETGEYCFQPGDREVIEINRVITRCGPSGMAYLLAAPLPYNWLVHGAAKCHQPSGARASSGGEIERAACPASSTLFPEQRSA